MTTLYTNNSGHRWVERPNIARKIQTPDGVIERRPKFYEAIGNFAVAVINYKGKLVRVPSTGFSIVEDESRVAAGAIPVLAWLNKRGHQ